MGPGGKGSASRSLDLPLTAAQLLEESVNDVDMLESLALRLIQGMEEMGITWWIFDGWSFRQVRQEELTTDGRGGENHEQESEPGGRVEAEVAAGNDGGESRRREVVPVVVKSSKTTRRAFATAKAVRRQAIARRSARGRVRKVR